MMEERKLVPEKRFKGFQGEWEYKSLESLLSDIIDNRGKTPPLNPEGKYSLIEVASLGGRNPDYANVTKYIDKRTYDSFLRGYISENDVLYSTVGRIGLVSLMDNNHFANIAQNIVGFRFKVNVCSNYMFALLSHKTSKKNATKIVMGAVQPSIKVTQLVHLKFLIPKTYDEQQKIGEFFKVLDERIANQERKISKVKALKEAYLTEMFPQEGETVPKRRFKGFKGEWEKKNISDLGEVVTGNTPSTSNSMNYNKAGIPWVTPTDIEKHITFTTERHLSKSGALLATVVPKNTILVTCIASIGKNTILGTKGSFNQQINGVIPNVNYYDPYFLYTNSYYWSLKLKRIAGSGTMQIVNKREFSRLEVNVPTLNEQQKIGAFFKNLDDQIRAEEAKLEKLKKMKEAYLEEMFV